MSVPLFCLKIHTSNVFFLLRHVYKRYLNVLIEPRPNPSLIKTLSVKPGLKALDVSKRALRLFLKKKIKKINI